MNYDFENFVGQNEVVTDAAINRCLQKLFHLQTTLASLITDEPDELISLSPRVLNIPWTPTPTPTPTLTPTPTPTPTGTPTPTPSPTPTGAPTRTPTPTPTITPTPTPTITPTPTRTPTPTPTPTRTPTPTPTVLPVFDIFINGPGPVNLRTAYNGAGSPTATNIRFIVQSDIGTTDPYGYALDTGDWSDKPAPGQAGYQYLILIVPAGKFVCGALGLGNPGTGTGSFGWGIGSPGGDAIRVRTHNLNRAIGSAAGGNSQNNAINWFNPSAGEYGSGSTLGGGGGGAGKADISCNRSPIGPFRGSNGAGWDGTQVQAAFTGGFIKCTVGWNSSTINRCDGGTFGAPAPGCGDPRIIPSAAGAPGGILGLKVESPYSFNYT